VQKFPIQLLKEWFLYNRRELPWREEPTPYRVWISEVMLQQTQVAVVIPYFEKWMNLFPSVEALATAPLEQVLKCWEGLGYYSRARHLHQAARFLVGAFDGKIPANKEELSKIKGIGLYTQAAIRSFAFKQKAAAVDGNVLRVLSRFLAFEEIICETKAQKFLRKYAESILPDDEPWVISEALIELGATVCSKKAHCSLCPLKKECLAFRHHLQDSLPKRKKRTKPIFLSRHVAVIACEGAYLIQKGVEGRVMADLYEFPYLESEGLSAQEITLAFEKKLGIPLCYIQSLESQKHTFTRYRVQLFPHQLKANSLAGEHLWKTLMEMRGMPFSSGHRRILNSLL